MASALVNGLAAPLRQLQATVGAGSPETAPVLAGIRDSLSALAAAAGRSWEQTGWAGDAADAASDFSHATVVAVERLAAQADRLGAAASDATDAVARARQRLQVIIDDFEARATLIEADIDEPGRADELVEEARRALAEANAVIDELRTELDGHQAAVTEPAAAAPAPTTTPMGALPNLGSGIGGGLGGVGSGSASGAGTGLSSGAGTGLSSGVGSAAPAGRAGSADSDPEPSRATAGLSDPGMFGSGVTVQLPDGSTATAPNAVAASAVRHALTQLGVPYDWGGTTPGVGLDCSGLTQWAYHEAGLDLPRLAQEQDIGAAVSQATLRPGDLAVWDGHVAMMVGNGLMIEAGDPVKLSPVRTTNAGQGFQGFWRPTV